MKRKLLLLVAIVVGTRLMAQVPQKMSYQAVLRNSSNTLITQTVVGMRISILQGSEVGTPRVRRNTGSYYQYQWIGQSGNWYG